MFASFGLAATLAGGCTEGEEAEQACESDDCEEDETSGGTTTGDPATSTTDDPAETEGSGGVASDEIPCDVANVLAANCGNCHGESPTFGAPMALTTISDFRVPSITDPAIDVAASVLARMDDTERPMPPDGSMSDADKALVQAWIDGGFTANDGPMCEIDEPEGPAVGPDELPCTPTAEFRAFADGTSDEPYAVPEVDDLYMCFVFESPFGEETQGTAWAPIIEDERVVHHWLLLKTDNPDYEVGTAVPCDDSVTLQSQMLMGWAPGTPNFVMPEEAGLELAAPGEKLILQLHYNNTAGYKDALDNSGVALCTTEEPRENKAATLWLGTVDIDVPPGETVTTVGDCDTGVRASEDVTMLLSWPHMHEVGTAIKTELIKGGNTDNMETIVDVPQWNFENQLYYPHTPALRIEQGDVLRTSCTYTNNTDTTVRFGEGTRDEMCFDFSIVYPIDAFSFENPFGPPELGRYCVGGVAGGGFP